MYSRRACGLCDEARDVVLEARHDTEFVFEEIFIDGDPALEDTYGLRVPVIAVDGREAFEIVVDPGALRRLVTG